MKRCFTFFGRGLLAAFWLIAAFPGTAHAYLDPGTGNVIIYLAISLVTALLYFCKNFFYGLRARLSGVPKEARRPAPQDGLVIFTEGKIYWPTFKPIVEALLARGFPFRYLSMDLEDPGLAVENGLMRSRHIGEGSAAFARAAAARALVMLETTPNIGTPGYPMPRPRHVQCRAHVLHGVGGVATYYKNSLDTCQAVLLMGGEDHDSIRLLEKKRGLPAKECVAAGLPYLDTLARAVQPGRNLAEPPCILVAPSWGEKNSLGHYGPDFLVWLLEAGCQVIVRPHPFSLKVEAPLVETLRGLLAPYPQASLDLEVDAAASLNRADLMISDKSGVRFDFAFLRERPVITLDMPVQNRRPFEIDELDYVWEDEMGAELGPVLSLESFRALDAAAFLALVKETLRAEPSRIAAIRDRSLANFGRSGEFIADWLIEKCRALAPAGN